MLLESQSVQTRSNNQVVLCKSTCSTSSLLRYSYTQMRVGRTGGGSGNSGKGREMKRKKEKKEKEKNEKK